MPYYVDQNTAITNYNYIFVFILRKISLSLSAGPTRDFGNAGMSLNEETSHHSCGCAVFPELAATRFNTTCNFQK